jgi:YteA family regulatory protein
MVLKPEQLKYFENRLLNEKGHLQKQIANLEKDGLNHSMGDSVSELSRYDNHPADLGSESFERGKDIALRDNLELMIQSIEIALGNIKNNNFGICNRCGRQISIERLQALPWATACIACQQDGEEVSDRPLEEESLKQPFGRTFYDNNQDFNGFDGEDALQAVMRYGSSDTPQDLPGINDYDHYYDFGEQLGIVDPVDRFSKDIDTAKTDQDKGKTGR